MTKMASITGLNSEIHREFKVLCAKKGESMYSVINEYMENLVEGEK